MKLKNLFFALSFRSCVRFGAAFILIYLAYLPAESDILSNMIQDTTNIQGDNKNPDNKKTDSGYLSKEAPDSIVDSNRSFYDSLRARSKDSWMEMLVNAVVAPSNKRITDKGFVESASIFDRFRGKRIKSIHIKQVNTFTGNVDDTTTTIFTTSILSILNDLHYETREWVIAKNLLFDIGDTLTAYTLSDNERVLRALPYIEDARMYIKISEADTNDVAITVVTRDVYSLGFSAAVNSLDNGNAKFYDRNFIGLGWKLQATYLYEGSKNPKNGVEFEAGIDNLRGTFISGLFQYRNTADEEGGRIEFRKPFITPETHYAGGLTLLQLHTNVTVSTDDTTAVIPITRNLADFWLGRQFLLTGGHIRRNIVISGRFYRREYTLRPQVDSDKNEPFHTVLAGLGSIMFTRVRFFESNMILGFGRTEDVPVGYRIKFTAGRLWSEFSNKLYSGILLTGARIIDPLGYFLIKAEFGNLYNGRRLEERVFKAHLLQFSPLIHFGSFRLRNFIRSNYIVGLELRDGMNISFNPESGIRGLPNFNLSGKQRFNLGMDMIAFAPWNLYGFKFALYGFADLGFVGPSNRRIDSSHTFSGFGFGFRIRNESLVFKTLQFRFAFYPKVPDGSSHYAFTTSTSDPQIFESFSGAAPAIIDFR